MKKSIFMAVVGLVCVALMGCGGSEPAPEEQSAEEFLEQLDEEYQEMVEAEEEQHEAELEAEYPEGILPAGKYMLPPELWNGNDPNYIGGMVAQYDSESEEGTILLHGEYLTTLTNSSLGGNADSYRYDPETGLYHFELYCRPQGEYIQSCVFEGYYNAEDDAFILTFFDYPGYFAPTEDGYEQVYYRE